MNWTTTCFRLRPCLRWRRVEARLRRCSCSRRSDAVRRSCEKLPDLALTATMQRTLSQEYICQHAQEKSLGEFFNTNNYSQYAPQAGASFPTETVAPADQTQPINPDPSIAANTSVQVTCSTVHRVLFALRTALTLSYVHAGMCSTAVVSSPVFKIHQDLPSM
jgi:hypothetical protein